MYIYIVLNLLVFSLGQKFGGKLQLFLLKPARASKGNRRRCRTETRPLPKWAPAKSLPYTKPRGPKKSESPLVLPLKLARFLKVKSLRACGGRGASSSSFPDLEFASGHMPLEQFSSDILRHHVGGIDIAGNLDEVDRS